MKRSLILTAIVLSACSENEDACAAKLTADFEQYAEAARASGDYEGAVAARESVLSITLIWSDDDRSACDYVSAGPELQRK